MCVTPYKCNHCLKKHSFKGELSNPQNLDHIQGAGRAIISGSSEEPKNFDWRLPGAPAKTNLITDVKTETESRFEKD